MQYLTWVPGILLLHSTPSRHAIPFFTLRSAPDSAAALTPHSCPSLLSNPPSLPPLTSPHMPFSCHLPNPFHDFLSAYSSSYLGYNESISVQTSDLSQDGPNFPIFNFCRKNDSDPNFPIFNFRTLHLSHLPARLASTSAACQNPFV